jgi:hypothetical protein
MPPRLKRRRASLSEYASKEEQKPESRYFCQYCGRDLDAIARIKCDTCKDFNLCPDCFSVGAERKPHANSHPYRIVEPMTFPVYAEVRPLPWIHT